MDVYAQIAQKIIKQQESIIGPVAIEQAGQVSGLTVDWDNKKVSIPRNGRDVINDLVDKYKDLFGQISVQVCKEAASTLLNELKPEELPEALK